MPAGTYTFGNDGKMIFAVAKNGLIQEADGLYYYVDGKKTHAGLVKVGDDYYYIDKTCKAVTGQKYVGVDKSGNDWTNYLLPAGTYTFGDDGKMLGRNGIFEEDGVLYFFINDVKTRAGLIRIGDDYYYVRSGGVVATGEYYVSYPNTNVTGFEKGTYTFGEDGKMIIETP